MPDMPFGYQVIAVSEDRDTVLVGADFSTVGDRCPEFIWHDGRKFMRGMQEAHTRETEGRFFALRSYHEESASEKDPQYPQHPIWERKESTYHSNPFNNMRS